MTTRSPWFVLGFLQGFLKFEMRAPKTSPTQSRLVPVLPEWAAIHGAHYQFLANQQHMLEDGERTGAYARAIALNPSDFESRTVLDVGAGTGILSIFAAQAGARKVYAVERTTSVRYARELIKCNGLEDRIEIVEKSLLDLKLPEKVDVVVSEPLGFLMFHERMVETFVEARDRFLAPNGKLYPALGRLWLAPFTDQKLYDLRVDRVAFWQQKDFFGADLSGLAAQAREELFAMPALGPMPPKQLIGSPASFDFDFRTLDRNSLAEISLPFEFVATHPGTIHGIAGWFDVTFDGSERQIVLSTAPDGPRTHWPPMRFVFAEPVAVRIGDRLRGSLVLRANPQASYTAHLDARGPDNKSLPPYRFDLHSYFFWESGE